jgi:serine phosphatase RsbU (regulator of sigma subunit)/CHASE2 domain-containing sensor protein
VNARPAREPAASAAGRIRLAGAALLALLAGLAWLQPRWTGPLQAGWFDTLQTLHPRQVATFPVTVVEIDERSLDAFGQWPWPRTILARLLRQIDAARPAAIGVNILMPEADALSPQRLLAGTPIDDETVRAALVALPSNDAVLAQAVGDTAAVLAIAGAPRATGMPLRAAPVMVRADAGEPPPTLAVTRYPGVLASIDELNRQAAGWGLISVDAGGGVVRRVPVVASIDGTLVPTLALELLRVAADARALRLKASGDSVTGVSVGGVTIPTEADGSVRVYFSGHVPERFVSAREVLDGRADPELFEQRLVLIGITGIGLHEYLDTPIGERMSGSEIQAQLLENLLDGTWLRRPPSAPVAEALALLLLGGLLVWVTPRWKPFAAAASMLGAVVLLLAIGVVAFRSQRLLLDAATPGVGLVLLFGVLLTLTLAEANRQRRLLERTVQAQREQAARVAGELAAAQRIQNSTLPRADLLAGDRRIDLAALLTPAREVGGDLYDYFRLDGRRLFFLVGDVAGKGLSASIFMAVSKALYKSVTLRTPPGNAGDDANLGLGRIMCLANAEVSRDNGEMLFVTAFAGVLDLDTGELAYCNAGHDNPYRLCPGSGLARIVDGDGPPLAAVPDFPYEGARGRLLPGEMLCLMSDGVSEAQDPGGLLFGAQRVEQVLLGCGAQAAAQDVVRALQSAVLAFASGSEPADDLTILVLRWLGPPAAA